MKLEVFNTQGEKTGKKVDLPDEIFGIEPNQHAIYLDVKAIQANARQGTHKAKGRSEIAGSTRKLHRQKGTGGSRKGDIKNPLYHGGGRIHGPQPRDYSQKVNKKVKRLARRSALASKAANGQIMVLEDFAFDAPKTKAFVGILKALNLVDKKTLLVTADVEGNVVLSCRNLPMSRVMRAEELNTYDILNNNTLILAEGAIERIKAIV